MTAEQILTRLAALKGTEVHIERGDYSTREKWSVRIVYNSIGFDDSTLDRVSLEAKHENFANAVIEAWEKFEAVALKGLGATVLQPAIEYNPKPDDYRD